MDNYGFRLDKNYGFRNLLVLKNSREVQHDRPERATATLIKVTLSMVTWSGYPRIYWAGGPPTCSCGPPVVAPGGDFAVSPKHGENPS